MFYTLKAENDKSKCETSREKKAETENSFLQKS